MHKYEDVFNFDKRQIVMAKQLGQNISKTCSYQGSQGNYLFYSFDFFSNSP